MNYHQETRFHKDGRRVVCVSYICGNYSRSGSAACSAHTIYQDRLAELVIDDICHYAKRMIEGEVAVRRDLIEKRNSDTEERRKEDKSQIKALESRLAELERLIQKLYEENVAGKISDEQFPKISVKYEQEQGKLIRHVKTFRKELKSEGGGLHTADTFLAVIRRYTDARELTQRMMSELIDHIDVYHAEKAGLETMQRITIQIASVRLMCPIGSISRTWMSCWKREKA